MAVILVVLAILAFLIFLVITAKIKLIFEYKKLPGEKLYTHLSLKIGFIKLDRILNFKKKDKKEEKKPKETFMVRIKQIARTLGILKKVYTNNRHHIHKGLTVDDVEIHIKFGLFDAAQTGIATGVLWSALYDGLAIATVAGNVKKHFFEVCPVYTEAGFISQGHIKLSVRTFKAALLALRLYKTYKMVSNENK